MYQKASSKVFALFHAKFRGFGLLSTFISFNISLYYNLILAYSIYFVIESFVSPLPWSASIEANPKEPWNSDYFYDQFLKKSSSID
jgi:SNF family Na+-dependent transporter